MFRGLFTAMPRAGSATPGAVTGNGLPTDALPRALPRALPLDSTAGWLDPTAEVGVHRSVLSGMATPEANTWLPFASDGVGFSSLSWAARQGVEVSMLRGVA